MAKTRFTLDKRNEDWFVVDGLKNQDAGGPLTLEAAQQTHAYCEYEALIESERKRTYQKAWKST